MFNKINPYNVSDKVVFQNVDKTLTLYVKTDAGSLVVGMKQAQDKLKALKDDTPECEKVNASRFFAQVIFGEEQGNQLVDFYNDPLAIITALGIYFDKRLRKKITKAQKKK